MLRIERIFKAEELRFEWFAEAGETARIQSMETFLFTKIIRIYFEGEFKIYRNGQHCNDTETKQIIDWLLTEN